MEYIVVLDAEEIEILMDLLGKTIDSIQIPGYVYSVRINSGEQTIDFTPCEYGTPYKENPYADVSRPIITNDYSLLRNDLKWRTKLEDGGIITQIAIMKTIVTYGTDEPVPDPDKAWEDLFQKPSETVSHELRLSDAHVVVELDIGIALFTSKEKLIIISTDGATFFVEFEVFEEIPSKWNEIVELVPIE